MSTKHTVPGNQSYRATYGTSQTQWPAQSRNGVTSQLTSVSSGVVTKAATSKLSAADLSIAVQQQFLSKSSQTLQNTAGRRSGSTGAHASKRQKKQHDGGTGDDDSEDVTIIEMGTKSVQSTTLVYSSSKDVSLELSPRSTLIWGFRCSVDFAHSPPPTSSLPVFGIQVSSTVMRRQGGSLQDHSKSIFWATGQM